MLEWVYTGEMYVILFDIEILQPGFMKIQGEQEGADVGGGLGDFYTEEVEAQGQDKDHRQEADALSGGGQDAGGDGVADGLEQHVVQDHPAGQGHGDALGAQGHGSDADDIEIIFAEKGDKLRSQDEAEDGGDKEYAGDQFHAEPEGVDDTFFVAGAEVKAADGLEALTEADGGGSGEHGDAGGDAHGGDRGVTVGFGGEV